MYIDRVKFAMYMAQKRIRINELAKRSGLSRTTVSSIKNGKSGNVETFKKLAKGLGVDVTDIIDNAAATADNEK